MSFSKLTTEDGTEKLDLSSSLHPTEGTLWVAFMNKFYFDSGSSLPMKTLGFFVNEKMENYFLLDTKSTVKIVTVQRTYPSKNSCKDLFTCCIALLLQ